MHSGAMEFVEMIGFAAGALTTLSYMPQAFRTYQTKSAHDLSWSMLVLYVAAVLFWIWYGIGISSMPVIISNIVLIVFVLAVCCMKFIYDGAKPGRKG